MSSALDRCRLLALPAVALLVACGGGTQLTTDAGTTPRDSGTIQFVDAGVDAGTVIDAGTETDAGPVDAGLDAGTEIDAGVDAGTVIDAGVDAGNGCVAETDEELCAAEYDECGNPEIEDSCGVLRTPFCGACGDHASCDPNYFYCDCDQGYSGDGFTCETCVPESDQELCAYWYDDCGTPTLEDSCGFERTVNCGTCGTNATCDADYYYCSCDQGYSGDGQVCEVCTPETDEEFCLDNYYQCGPLDSTDSCGFTRTVDCGSCSGHGTCDSFDYCACDPGYTNSGTACVPEIGTSCLIGDGTQQSCPDGQVCIVADGVTMCTITECTTDSDCGANGYYDNTCRVTDTSTYCQPHCDPTYISSCNSPDMICVSQYPVSSDGVCTASCRLQSSEACGAATYAATCNPLIGSCDLTTCSSTVECPSGQICFEDTAHQPAWQYCVEDCRGTSAAACADGRTCNATTGACDALPATDGGPLENSTLPDGGVCVPETDEELCAAADAFCGSYEHTDSCGNVRTPNCGTCTGDTYCDRELLKCTCRPGFNELDGGSCTIGIGQGCLVGDGTQQDCPPAQNCVPNGPVNLCTITTCVTSSDCGTNGWRSNVCSDGYCIPRCDPTLGTTACGSPELVCYPTSTYAGDCYLDCRRAEADYCDSAGYGAVCDPANGRCTFKLCSDVLECDANEICYADTTYSPVAHYCLPDCKQGALCPADRVCNQESGACELAPAADGGTP